jgi:transcriptional regulator with XRE-family HTH domain
LFGELVRTHRRRWGLTQEELSTRTGLGPRTIRDLESGRIRRPRQSTVRLLAEAFGLTGDDHERFQESAFGPVSQPSATAGTGPAGDTNPAQLPTDAADFAGREQELAQLDAIAAGSSEQSTAAVICVVSGSAGVGKTALAVHWGHCRAGRFPDGQLHVDLRGYAGGPAATPIEALTRFLRALGVPPDQVPTAADEAAELYRTRLANRRMLVICDNAGSADQVRPLLPGGPGNVAIITSRERLRGLVAREGARRIDLDPLTDEDAVALLARSSARRG